MFVTATESADGALARSQAARRRRVIDATLQLAAGGGFDAVQMRDVAAEAGVALGTVYRYFESKERLLLEANLEQVEALRLRLSERPPAGESAADRVVDVLRRATPKPDPSPRSDRGDGAGARLGPTLGVRRSCPRQ